MRRLVPVLVLLILLLAGCGPAAPEPEGPPPSEEPGETVSETEEVQETAPPPEAETRPTSPLTGLPYDPAEAGSIVAVMVDNHRDARPQSGLTRADLVYEALTEFNITRFLALYHSRAADVIGPVRSARPYFVLLAREWNAIYAHCHGLPKDLKPIKELGVLDADELLDPRGFWRDGSRRAPHNLYTSTQGLRERMKVDTGTPKPWWEFTEFAAEPVRALSVEYDEDYVVSYRLDGDGYLRFMNGRPHVDRETGTQIKAANVIVQFVPHAVVYEDGGRELSLVGEGRALYLLGGRRVSGTWEKKSALAPTYFFDEEGELIQLAPGQTWIQIVPLDAEVQFFD